MQFRLASVLSLALLTISLLQGGEPATPKDFKGGSSASVKDWKPRAFDTIKGGYLPMVIYVYDPEPKKNALAFHFEGKDALDNAEVKEKISKFAKIKIKTDGTDVKGWTEQYLKPAEKGASLYIMSADQSIVIPFDKTKSVAERGLPQILAAIAAVQAHEDKLKADKAAKDAKEAKAAQAAAEAHKQDDGPAAGFTIDTSKKPLDPKKVADAKKTDPKAADPKAADAKKPGDKTADPKKDGKKLPEDE